MYFLILCAKATSPNSTFTFSFDLSLNRLKPWLYLMSPKTASGSTGLFRAQGKKYTDRELLEIFSNPDTPVFVYEEQGEVLGYAFCALQHQESGSLMPISTLYIDDICVDEKARGRHIGSALFEYVRHFAQEKGCHNITLHVWECNPGAAAFYRSLGMTPQYTSMEMLL